MTALLLAAMGAAHAQRMDVDPTRASGPMLPIPLRTGELIASDIGDADYHAGPESNAEYFLFAGRAGKVVTAQVRSDVPTLEVMVVQTNSRTGIGLVQGPARDAPLRLTLPHTGTYYLIVHAKGPQRQGKYMLSFGTGDAAPAFAEPTAAAAPASASANASASTPMLEPALPDTPGIINIRSGQTIARKGGEPTPAIEVFRFTAGAGSRVRAKVAGSATGAIVLRVYTPEGTEMRREQGASDTTLDLFMPRDGIYYMSVARNEGEKDYQVKLDIIEAPSVVDAALRYAIGYETLMDDGQVASTSCWIESGKKFRAFAPGVFDVEYSFVGADMVVEAPRGAGAAPPRWFKTSAEGNELVRTYQDAKVFRYAAFGGRLGAYRGYYCEGAEL